MRATIADIAVALNNLTLISVPLHASLQCSDKGIFSLLTSHTHTGSAPYRTRRRPIAARTLSSVRISNATSGLNRTMEIDKAMRLDSGRMRLSHAAMLNPPQDITEALHANRADANRMCAPVYRCTGGNGRDVSRVADTVLC